MRRFTIMAALLGLAVLLFAGPAPAAEEEWVAEETEHFRFIYLPRSRGLAEKLMPSLEPELARVSAFLKVEPPGAIGVVYAPDRAAFSELQGGGVPDWVSGMAYPDKKAIYLRPITGFDARHDTERAVLAHELGHVVLRERLGGRRPPRWLDEGMAVYVSNEALFSRTERLMPLGLGGRTIPFENLRERFPAEAESAATAYAQAGDFVRFLYSEFGYDAMDGYLEGLASGAAEDEAFAAAFGMPLKDAEDLWRSHLRWTYGIIPSISGGALLWFLMALLAIVAYFRKRSRARKRLALMAIEEKLIHGDAEPAGPGDLGGPDDDDDGGDGPLFKALH